MKTKLQSFMKSHPIVTLVIALVIAEVGTQFIPTGDSPWLMAAVRVALAAIMVSIIIVAASPSMLTFDFKGIRFALRKGAYVICLALFFGLFTLLSDLIGGKDFVLNWVSAILGTVVLAISVGIFEEGLFRVISISAFIKLFGNTRKGVFWAIMVSSIIFGFIHNTGFLYSGSAITSIEILQMVLKTIQTGMLGFLLGAIYLKTKSIWGIAIIHALTDLMLLLPEFLYGATGVRNYVQAGDAGMISVFGYLVFIVLYIPAIISAWRIIKTLELPVKGIFDNDQKS